MIEEIRVKEKLVALVIRKNYEKPGISFLTPDDFSQQLAYIHHPQGKIIEAHVHNCVPREVHYTQEVLVIKKGLLRVDLYSDEREYIKSLVLGAGDVILLASGGHGFEMLEEVEMIEIKQGPYAGGMDKVRFEGIKSEEVTV
ncbi:MAG TPA: hypothetical protein VJ205_00975 [Gammaproteobacteria bacterium]|nr:hypothetical protein [Gammaproteobacteria bacterium]